MKATDFALGERVELLPMVKNEPGIRLAGSPRGFVVGYRQETVIVEFKDPDRTVRIGHLPEELRRIDVVEAVGELDDAPSA